MYETGTANIRIIHPSSPDVSVYFKKRQKELKHLGLRFIWKESSYTDWHYNLEAVNWRLDEFVEALFDEAVEYIWAARGGYGATDLLAHLPWQKLEQIKPKWIIGFSDISALHSAFYTKLAWPGVHGPMPGTEYWGANGSKDIAALLEILQKKNCTGVLSLKALKRQKAAVEGELFGGCLSVLASLIGTEFIPRSFNGRIFFVEDISETPGQVLRNWNQLLNSKTLEEASGVILGSFNGIDEPTQMRLKGEMARRTSLPVWDTEEIGHKAPNLPLVVGGRGVINNSRLTWQYDGDKH